MKAINYKMKKWKVRLLLQSKSSRHAIIQNMSYVYKKSVKYDKNQK